MITPPADNRTGRQLLKALRTSVARFYPCDLHVHSLGSYDICQSGRFEYLPNELRAKVVETAGRAGLSLPLAREPADVAAFDEMMAIPELVNAFLNQLVTRRDSIALEEGLLETDN